MRAPNLSAWRRSTVGDLTATLHLGQAGHDGCPRFPPTTNDPAYVGRQGLHRRATCSGVATDQPPYPLPAVQQMPTQEPATAAAK